MRIHHLIHALLALALSLATGADAHAQPAILRGDVNTDGRVSTSDSMLGRRYLFLGGALDCVNTLDVDDSGNINITDTVFTPDEMPQIRGGADIFSFAGTYYDGVEFGLPVGVVNADPENGTLRVGFITGILNDEHEFPSGTALPMLKLRGTIASDAQPGAVIDLVPTNEAPGPAARVRNELTHRGETRLLSIEPKLVGGLLEIVGDQIFFRGDANADGAVALADAVHTLDYLFQGGPEPKCLDAADANDSGRVDITDPVYTLLYLFASGRELPPPSTSAGIDPTPDALDCAYSTR